MPALIFPYLLLLSPDHATFSHSINIEWIFFSCFSRMGPEPSGYGERILMFKVLDACYVHTRIKYAWPPHRVIMIKTTRANTHFNPQYNSCMQNINNIPCLYNHIQYNHNSYT